MAKNAVQKVEESENALTLAPELLDMVSSDAGEGLNDMGADDFAIPRIGIIQSLSPQRSSQKPEYIEGCVEGQIFENVTKKLWKGDEGIVVIPVAYSPAYIEWHPRGGEKKGMAKHHGKDATLFNATPAGEKGKRITKDGTIVQRSGEYYVMIIEKDKAPVRAVLSMGNSALRQAKAWNNLINQSLVVDSEGKPVKKDGKTVNAPIFYYAYSMKTVPTANQDGQWFRWEVSHHVNEAGVPQSVLDLAGGQADIYNAAKQFRDAITSGAVKVADPVDEGDTAATETEEDPM